MYFLQKQTTKDLFRNIENGTPVTKNIIKDVQVFDSHFTAFIMTDLYIVRDAQGHDVVIGSDATNQLFEVNLHPDNNGLSFNNSNGFGTIDHNAKTVTGWNFDREELTTTPEGYTTSGYYAQ